MTTTLIEVPISVVEAIEKARAARDEGMAQAEEADRDGWDKKVIDQAVDAFAAAGRPFSANDVRDVLPDVRASLIGARFMAASVQGRIRRVGFTTSTKKNTHCKPVAVWVRARHTQEAATA